MTYNRFCELRDRVKGYAIALIKAGLAVTGRPAGPVRPPLVYPSAEHEAELRAIIARGMSLQPAVGTEERR